ncbi:MAG: transcriptional regulator, partial [Verrucomicrobiales bacterium]
MVSPKQDPPSAEGLNSVEAEFVAFFVQMATALSLPRSVGEIFGYLFAADEPKPFDEVVSRLGISKGSASQGLKFLLGMGAIS